MRKKEDTGDKIKGVYMGRKPLLFLICATILLWAMPSRADPALDKAVWVATTASRIRSQDRWEYVDYLAAVNNTHKRYPTDPLPTISEALLARATADQELAVPTWLLSNNQSRVPAIRRANRVYEALKQAGPAGHILGSFIQDVLKASTQDMELNALLSSNRQHYASFASNSEHLRETLGETYDLAQTNSQYKEVVNEVFGRSFGVKIGDKAEDIIKNDPVLSSNKYINDIISNPSDQPSILNVKKEIFNELKNQSNKIDVMLASLKGDLLGREAKEDETQAKVDEIVKIIQDNAAEQRKIALDNYELNGLRSAGFVVAALMNDKQAGRLVNSTINAVIDVYQALNAYKQYESALSKENSAEEAGAMGGAILTMNFIAIGVQFLKATEPPPVSPEQIILEAMQKLSNQIKFFQDEVRTRFDRIDSALNTIYEEMSRNFFQIYNMLSGISTDVGAIQRSLDRGQLRLLYFEQTLGGKVDYLISLPFKSAMSRCLNFERDSGHKMSDTEYTQCVQDIRAFFEGARDPQNSGKWSVQLSNPDNLATALENQDWAGHVNILREIIRNYGGFRLNGDRANMSYWLIAVQHYLALIRDNQERFQSLPAQLLVDMQSEGDTFVRELNYQVLEDQESSMKIFTHLLDDYAKGFDRFNNAARSVRAATLKRFDATVEDSDTHPGVTPTNLESVLAEIVTRPINPASAESTKQNAVPTTGLWAGYIPVTDQNWPPLGNPAHVWREMAKSFDLVNAEALGLGKLEIAYVTYYKDNRSYDNGAITNNYAKPKLRFLLFLKDGGGNRRLLATSQTSDAPDLKYYAQIRAGTGYAVMGIDQFVNVPEYVKAASRSFGGPEPFEIVDPKLTEDLKKQQSILVNAMRADLDKALSSPGSDLESSVRNLNSIVFTMRGLTSLIIPNASKQNLNLHQLLNGRPRLLLDIPVNAANLEPTTDDQNAPLLTSQNAFLLVRDIVPNQIKDGRICPSDNPAPSEAWKNSVLLSHMTHFKDRAVKRFAANIELAIRTAAVTADIDPTINEAMGKLQLLRRTHEEKSTVH